MKDPYTFFKRSIFLCGLLLLIHSPCSARIYIHAYVRSGNHLFAYSLSHILNKPIVNPDEMGPVLAMLPHKMEDIDTWFGKPCTFQEDTIFIAHFSKNLGLNRADPTKDILIVLLRDYHECMLRNEFNQVGDYGKIDPLNVLNYATTKYTGTRFKKCYSCSDLNYINIIRCYDKWNVHTRYLIYYEDLILHFEKTMQELLEKFNITEHFLPQFMENYEERMLEIKELYRKYHMATLSEGDIHYHKKQLLSNEQAKEFDAIFRDNYPVLWEKYLKRYETTE